MKKIILLLILFNLSFCAKAYDYSSFCAPEPISKNISGNILSLIGLNFLSKNIIESQITHAVKKELNSKIKINLDNFYGVNILSGKFKSLEATSKEFNFDGFYFSNLKVNTVCPYNYVSIKNKELVFMENMALKYSTEITQDNIDKIINSSFYQNLIDKMNSNKIISKAIKIQNSNIQIKDNDLILDYKIVPSEKTDLLSSIIKNYIKPANIKINANLKANNGKVELCNLSLNSKTNKYNDLSSIINLLNPLSYNLDINKSNKGELKVENVEIKDNKIYLDGIVLIKKNG
ncbi:MAG: hypothetical protein IJ003_01035 [Candidatus Gastranaerophilales bacterium]|nr:hypothetical protein [Candidatus Gastranaerophilales bacterium]